MLKRTIVFICIFVILMQLVSPTVMAEENYRYAQQLNFPAYAWSDQAVDFPSCRSQGYHYYSNRHYGFAPGTVYNEKDMWLWMKKGLVTVDDRQIDWFGAKKDGRAAFVFTNASDAPVTTTVTFGDEVGMGTRVNSVIYTPSGTNTQIIENKTTTLTVPPKTTLAIAFNATVNAPDYAKMYGTNLTDYSASYAASSVRKDKDVIGHTVQITPDSYHAYVYAAYRPSTVDPAGISMAIMRYSIGGDTWQAITDSTFPFEFDVKVEDAAKDFQYKVELYDADRNKVGTSDTCTLKACAYEAEVPIRLSVGGTRGTTISTAPNPTITGWNGNNNTAISATGNCFAFFKVGNDTGKDVDVTGIFVLVDADGHFKRVAKIVQNTVPAKNTSSNMMNFSTLVTDPIVLTEEDIGCHLVVFLWNSMETMKPCIDGKYNFATGNLE